jgi:hypothetical protein
MGTSSISSKIVDDAGAFGWAITIDAIDTNTNSMDNSLKILLTECF